MSDSHTPLATGTRAQALEALRTLLATNLVTADPPQVAALSKEFRAVLAEQAASDAPSADPLEALFAEVGYSSQPV